MTKGAAARPNLRMHDLGMYHDLNSDEFVEDAGAFGKALALSLIIAWSALCFMGGALAVLFVGRP